MFLVGVIPGPREPSLAQINHLLSPLVDDLLQLWNSGVRYSCTPAHPNGCLVKAALVPLVCDLPAARRVAGFAGASATRFCAYCALPKAQINELDMTQWPPRDPTTHHKHAQAWLDAPNPTRQKALVKEHGIRFSELLRLPYWEPSKMCVIDTMHGILLRLLGRHCQSILGMGAQLKDEFDPSADLTNRVPDHRLPRSHDVDHRTLPELSQIAPEPPASDPVATGSQMSPEFSEFLENFPYWSDSRISRLRSELLRTMCLRLDLPPEGKYKKDDYINFLKNYVRHSYRWGILP
ncbi:hypothetical protein SISNIDRAFT_420968 [Sistotremastrum niveocremeum HHB9708]|uniref:Uncharacterized protein n=1 Tax=Sistotremastrum niveocremeum HHB9708 TaxID=1314777 RepID=A0A164M5X3_9AGAM|nr:hypothetical protein SISNIDRAFT_420968 [Sistotremastrum niveocremeum HHB9708]